MPSEILCVRCGAAIDPATIDVNRTSTLCPACADWQRVVASDQEDRQDATGLGAMRPALRGSDPNPHV
jgi:hypothetical protein